jgi:hypothetical protein
MEAETVKGARYPLSKNSENLTGSQQAALEIIAKSNPKSNTPGKAGGLFL